MISENYAVLDPAEVEKFSQLGCRMVGSLPANLPFCTSSIRFALPISANR